MKSSILSAAVVALVAIASARPADLLNPNQPALPYSSGGTGSPAGSDPMYTFVWTGGGITASGTLDATAVGGGLYEVTAGSVTYWAGLTRARTVSSATRTFRPQHSVRPGRLSTMISSRPAAAPRSRTPACSSATGSTIEVNIFSNFSGAPGTYSFDTYDTVAGVYVVAAAGTFSLVPEPSTMVLASLGGVAFVAYGWRRRRAARA